MGQLPQDRLGLRGPILDFRQELANDLRNRPHVLVLLGGEEDLPAPVGRDERDAAVVRDLALTIFRFGANEVQHGLCVALPHIGLQAMGLDGVED
eukprot:4817958-Lingulodinium_polyedra.AAC.1